MPTHPKLYKPGRIEGTQELVVCPNYIVVYREGSRAVTILRVLHAAQQWPKQTPAQATPNNAEQIRQS